MKNPQTARYRFTPGPASPISVSYAELCRPKEVAKYFSSWGYNVPDALTGSWLLWAQLPQTIFDHWHAQGKNGAHTGVSYCRTLQGANYAVITHHLASKQHRFLLPLWDEGVLAGVETMQSRCLKFLFQRGETRDAVLFDSEFEAEDLAQAFTGQPPSDSNLLTSYLGEMKGVIESTMQLGTIPSQYESDVVNEVAVSVLPPHHAIGFILDGQG